MILIPRIKTVMVLYLHIIIYKPFERIICVFSLFMYQLYRVTIYILKELTTN